MELNYQNSESEKRIIFAGGTDWSQEFFHALVDKRFNIIGVLAPPDSKKDRGQKVIGHPLKIVAEKIGIPVFQPEKLSNPDFLRELKKLKPDLVVVVAYGKLFPKEILDIPQHGFINFHPSLLPKLRGPSPIQSAILEGLNETGVSIMKLGEGMDSGTILAQKNIKMDPRETSVTLTRKLVDLGKEMLPDVLKIYLRVETGHAPSLHEEQDETEATFCKMLRKEDGKIDWQNETAETIDRKVRALNPQIKTFTFLEKNNRELRVNILETAGIYVETQHAASQKKFNPGQYQIIKKYLAVGTKKNILLINKLQIEGKKPLSAEEFIRGYHDGKFSSQ